MEQISGKGVNLAKQAKGLEQLVLRLKTLDLIGNKDFDELVRLAITVSARAWVLEKGNISDIVPIKSQLTQDIGRISVCCDRIIKQAGIFAPINLVYLKHHYLRLNQELESLTVSAVKDNKKLETEETGKIQIGSINLLVSQGAENRPEPVVLPPASPGSEVKYYPVSQNTSPRQPFYNLQKAILGLFEKTPILQLKEVKTHFPGYGGRTLRKYLAQLVRLGYLKQQGFAKGSRYEKSSLA